MGMIDNASAAVKLFGAKRKFVKEHPKFWAFFQTIISNPLPVGSIIEVRVTKPDGSSMTTNMKVKRSDIEIMKEIQTLLNRQ